MMKRRTSFSYLFTIQFAALLLSLVFLLIGARCSFLAGILLAALGLAVLGLTAAGLCPFQKKEQIAKKSEEVQDDF
jgi:hypothetical protein